MTRVPRGSQAVVPRTLHGVLYSRAAAGLLTALLFAAPSEAYRISGSPAGGSFREDTGSASIQLALEGCTNPQNDATVELSVVGAGTNPATPGVDVGGPSPGSVVLGESATTRTVQIPIFDDDLDEPNEGVEVRAMPGSAPLECDEGTLFPVQSSFPTRFTIVDDDAESPSLPTLAIGNTSLSEGDEGMRIARFPVTVTPPPNQTVSVPWQTVDGSARAGSDYTGSSGVLLIEPGASGGRIEVPVHGDREPEGDETFFVTLGTPSGATLGDSRGRAVIRDDDSRPLGIELVGDPDLSGREGDTLTLEVRVTDQSSGDPVGGVQVTWEVTGNASPVDSPGSQAVTSQTGTDGIAILRVRLGQAGTAGVAASIPDGDSVAFTIGIRGELAPLFDPESEPGPRSVAEVVDDACEEATGAFRELCRYLFDLEDADARRAILELTPREAGAMAIVAREGARAQIDNVLDQLRVRRRGTGGSLESLALVIEGRRIAATDLSSALRDSDPDLRLAALMQEALAEPPEPETPVDPPLPEGVSRWSLFASGQVSSGDRDETALEPGFDLRTTGLTIGVDFQANARWVLGLAAGWLDSGNDFTDGGSFDAEGYSATVFAGFAGEAAYFDLVGSWGSNEYDLTRRLDLPARPEPVVARGAPEGDQIALAAALGYDATFGANGLGLFARASWVEATIDPFDETGAGAASLSLDEQTLESLLTEAGVELTRAVSLSWGVFLPQLRLSWLHELEDDARVIRGRFVEDRSFLEFVVPTDVPDADYFNAGAGFTLTFARGWSAYLFADQDLARDDLDLLTVAGGFRVEL